MMRSWFIDIEIMKQNLGILYMGSKRKLASDILQKITARHRGITDFYDLFGGGGSISFTAIRDYRFNVHYNELNRHILSLVEYLKSQLGKCNHSQLAQRLTLHLKRRLLQQQWMLK